MGISVDSLKIAARNASPVSRAAMEAIAGGGVRDKQAEQHRQPHKRGQISKAERRYSDIYLEPALQANLIVGYTHESTRLKLAHGASYSPDWVVIHWDGSTEYVEVKGSGPKDRERDSRNRWKWAASLNPDARFTWAKEQKGGGFKVEEFKR